MDFNTTLEELNIMLGDTDNVTFTQEEKIRALRKAWNDPYVVDTVYDSSLVFSRTASDYTLPDTLTTVSSVGISASNSSSDFPEQIEPNLWEVVGTTLRFKDGAMNKIPNGYTLYLKGNYKLDYAADTLETVNKQEYVIALAGYNTLMLLGYKKANLFLKNDTTVGELITLKRDLKQDISEARAKLQRSFEAV